MAWRKVAGCSRTYIADRRTCSPGCSRAAGVFKVRHPGDGRHVEARLNQQVLALINGGKVERIYHTSSGTPSTPTVRGQVPRLPQDAGHQRQGHGRLELLHPRLRDPRLRRRAAVQRQPRLPARAGRRTRGRSTTGCGSATSSGSSRRSRRRAGPSTLGHAAGGVGLAHAVRAAALAQDALDLLERVLAVEVARVGARERERVGADLAHRAQRAAPPDRRVDAVAAGAEGGLARAPRSAASAPRRRRRRPRRARGSSAASPATVSSRRLRVHRAHLDRAEARARPDVPPQVRVVRRSSAAADAPADELLRSPPSSSNGRRDRRAREGAEDQRARAGEAGVAAVPERRVGGERLQQRQVGAQPVADVRSPSRGPASRRGRAARRSACARRARASRRWIAS